MPRQHSVVSITGVLYAHLDNRPPLELVPITSLRRGARAPALVDACQAQLAVGGVHPCYDPDSDTIIMPPKAFYAVLRLTRPATRLALDLLHELAHWSGHRRRIGRCAHVHRFDAIYNREEVIAELTSALLCHDLKLTSRPTLPHARYINVYLATLPNPAVDLATALAHANQAAAFIVAIARRRLQG